MEIGNKSLLLDRPSGDRLPAGYSRSLRLRPEPEDVNGSFFVVVKDRIFSLI